MKELDVYIEIQGEPVLVGEIIGNNHMDACFSYSSTYGICQQVSWPVRI